MIGKKVGDAKGKIAKGKWTEETIHG